MRAFFKHYFIPHEGNEHQPHLLRWEAMLSLGSLALVVEMLFLAQFWVLLRYPDLLGSIINTALVEYTNAERTPIAKPLAVSPLLEKAARLKAEDMAAKGYFSHVSPEGLTPWYWFGQAGYRFSRAGENLAVNFTDSQDVVRAWLDSPTHRANLLNENYTEIGIGIAKGLYRERETIFIVQLFGRPMVKAAPAVVAAASVPSAPDKTTSGPERIVPAAPQSPTVAAAETEAVPFDRGVAEPKPPLSAWKRVLGSPRGYLNLIYATLATIVFMALLLAVFVKIEIQYPALLVNGAVFLICIASILLLNRYIALTGAAVI